MRVSTALVGVAFPATVFFLLPRAFMFLNEALGWPRLTAAPLLGWALIVTGVAVHIVASRRFRRAGGTPVPTEPPTQLMREGLFGYSRNPIYLADLVILLGIFALRGHLALSLYVLVAGVALHVWVVLHEESVLSARFGAAWDDYCARVPRWLAFRLGNSRTPGMAGGVNGQR